MNKLIIKILRFYKTFVSPILERMFGRACRFTPTCGEYTITALEKFGVRKGITLSVKRLARCHPWGGEGYDPVGDLAKS